MPRTQRPSLDSAAGRPQTAVALVFLTVDADPGGQVMANVVRIVLEELRELPLGGDR
jgi:hypothetical protein